MTDTGSGHVLVMDDEEFVLDMVADILDNIGCTVEFARDGKEAIELYKTAFENGNPYHAVIIDLTIPEGMGGKEAIQELLKIDPDIKAIVSSGYSQDPIMADYVSHGFVDVIVKPYNIRDLQTAVQNIIEKNS